MNTKTSLATVCVALALSAALPAVAESVGHHPEHQPASHQTHVVNRDSNAPLNQQALRIKTTVAAAKKLPDDSKVVLEGVLVKQIAHERYQFRDATGTIQVEIDDKDWNGRAVHAGQKLRLIGEVDHHRVKPVDIDVKSVEWL